LEPEVVSPAILDPKVTKWHKNAQNGLLGSQLVIFDKKGHFHITTDLTYQTENRIRKPKVFSKLQKMAQNNVKLAEMWTTMQHSKVMTTMCF